MPRPGKKIQRKLEQRMTGCNTMRKNNKNPKIDPVKAFKMPGSRKWKQ